MQLKVTHRTAYSYEKPLSYGLQELRLTPKTRSGQTVLDWQMQLTGGRVEAEFQDHHMNHVKLISFSGEGHEITVTAEGTVETADQSGVVGRHRGFTPLWLFRQPTELTRAGNQTRHLIKGLSADYPEELARLHELSSRVLEAVDYRPGSTGPETTAEAALEARQGVCQDHAHVFIAAARAMGIPARYISGYLMMDDRTHQQASHAWAEAHVEGLGWVGFDISNSIAPDERYVCIATGLDYREAAPVSGLRFGDHGQETLAVDIQVQQ